MTTHAWRVDATLRQKLGRDANDDDIEELTNLVFRRMIKGLSGLELERCFKTWLMTIAERVAYSYLRVLVRYRKNGKLPEMNAEVAIDHQLNQEREGQVLPGMPTAVCRQADDGSNQTNRQRTCPPQIQVQC